MRALLLLLLFAVFSAAPSFAGQVLEVQNIHIEQKDNGGRDAAVAEATRQAAAQVWAKLGRTTPLPDLSAEKLQALASYVDISNEVAQPNYYAANFNIGINVSVLGGGSLPTASNSGKEAASPSPTPAAAHEPAPPKPNWVLIVAGHEVNGQLTFWNAADAWTAAWQRAPSAGFALASAGGDEKDMQLLPANGQQGADVSLYDKLRALQEKYDAPAAALVILSSTQDTPQLNEEVKIEVSYYEPGLPALRNNESSLFVSEALRPNFYIAGVTEGQRLIAQMLTPDVAVATSRAALTQATSSTVASAAPTPQAAQQKLWVRIPLASPMDLANYRSKIGTIPGAKFEITALNRMYVEGNIVYSGNKEALMNELAARGLRQQ